jgi:hypothetical protein
MRTRTALSCFGCVLAMSGVARAQELRGTVTDSATHSPLSGVVVSLLDGSGRVVSRAISNENGLYRVVPTTGAVTVSTLRIGFRPRSVAFVVDTFGRPIANAAVDIARRDGSPDQSVTESLDTDDSGIATSCLIYHSGDEFVITVTQGAEPPYSELLRYRSNNLTLRLKAKKDD